MNIGKHTFSSSQRTNLFSSVVYDCSSCLCLHWLLGCPISCVPGWLVTSFPHLIFFIYLPSERIFIPYLLSFFARVTGNFFFHLIFLSICHFKRFFIPQFFPFYFLFYPEQHISHSHFLCARVTGNFFSFSSYLFIYLPSQRFFIPQFNPF